MLQPELKLRRDKIRSLMALQGIDAALITCNANLIYTYGCVVSGYLYLPLHSPALLFFKRPNNITGEHSFSIRKPEQIAAVTTLFRSLYPLLRTFVFKIRFNFLNKQQIPVTFSLLFSHFP